MSRRSVSSQGSVECSESRLGDMFPQLKQIATLPCARLVPSKFSSGGLRPRPSCRSVNDVKRNRPLRLLLALILVLLSGGARAQVPTGTPPFGSYSGCPIDTINNANLNANIKIPVFTKAGQGLSFYYILSTDTSIWYPLGATWTNVSNWGWRGITASATGYMTMSSTQAQCRSMGRMYI